MQNCIKLRNIHKILSSGLIWLIFCMWQYFMSSRGVMAFSEVYRLCMHACMHMHAHMQISNEASGQSFYMVILYLCAKNWISTMFLHKRGYFLLYALGLRQMLSERRIETEYLFKICSSFHKILLFSPSNK